MSAPRSENIHLWRCVGTGYECAAYLELRIGDDHDLLSVGRALEIVAEAAGWRDHRCPRHIDAASPRVFLALVNARGEVVRNEPIRQIDRDRLDHEDKR